MDEFLTEYRAFSTDDLYAERDRLVDALDSDDVPEDATERVDALVTVIEERTATDARRREQRDRVAALPARQTSGTTAVPRDRARQAPVNRLDVRSADAVVRGLAPALESFQRAGYKGSHGVDAWGLDAWAFGATAETRAAVDTTSVPTIQDTILPSIVEPRSLTPSVLDFIGRSPTTASAITFVTETSAVDNGLNAANPVAEGALKPEATFVWTPTTVPLEVVAGYKGITRQTLQDAPAIRGVIESRLRRSLREVIERQVLIGTGTTPQMQGIVPGATAATLAAGLDEFQKVNAAIAEIEETGYSVDGIGLHPADWQRFAQAAAAGGAYQGSLNPFVTAPLTVWGIPVFRSRYLTAGTALVGNFSEGSTLYYRNDVQILVADQHSDLFLRNTLVLLAEARLAHAVQVPGDAYRTVNLNAA